jgi:hypothetical protein
MIRSLAPMFVVAAACLVGACSDDDPTPTGGGAAADSGTPSPGGGDAAAKVATWGDVHTQLKTKCTPCHATSGSGGHNMAQSDATAAHGDSQKQAAACVGKTKGECAGARVRAGTMPPGGGLPAADRAALADLIDAWVAGGQKP